MSDPVLLVHGAFTGAWAWRPVLGELERRGIDASAIDLPSRRAGGTFASDVASVRGALKDLRGPAVLVGHSYAGAVITAASANNDDVARLVYVCAALPQEGESVSALMQRDPDPGQLGSAIRPTDDGMAVLDPVGAKAHLCNDATGAQATPFIESLGSHALATFGEAVHDLGWKDHPVTYLLCTRDKTFSPALQREFARHAETVVEVDSGHCPMLTRPAAVADAITATERR
ncbi:alpha/beta fold hydrolase [Rhodococcus sp. 2H158]